MADVFLSYKREDAPKVRKLVAALRDQGLETWWDEDIPPSAPWEATIERQLRTAKAVIVCWSPAAVASENVRAEARVAREGGRLIQLFMRPCEPPLFFGERQGVDLTNWRGRADDPRIRKVVESARAVAAGRAVDQGSGATQPRFTRRRIRAAALVAVLLVIAAAALLYFGRSARDDVPTVRVAHAGADAALSRELATNLATDLQRLQQARSDRFALLDGSSRSADLDLAVGASSSPKLLQANVTLKAGPQILWSSAFEVPSERKAEVRQQLAARVAAILNCALDARPVDKSRADPTTLKLILRACEGINFDRATGAPDRVIAALEQAVWRNPNVAAAWSMLAHAQMVGDRGEAAVRRTLERANQLNPNYGLNFYTEALLLPPGSWGGHMRLANRAVAAAPGDSMVHVVRANALARVGRMAEAITEARLAVQLDPISQDTRLSYIELLADAGRLAEALAQLDDADRTWPGDLALAQTRYRVYMRYGDPRVALRILDSTTGELMPFSAFVEGVSADRVFLLARSAPSPANVNAAIEAFRNMQAHEVYRSAQLLQALATFGRIDEAAAMLKDPAAEQWKSGSDFLFRTNLEPLRRRREFLDLTERLGLVQFWRSTRKWPDFCRDPQLPYDCATGRVRSAPGLSV